MPDYHHQFDSIEDYLHHRAPYLLVEEIVSIGEDRIQTRTTLRGDEFFLQGHFPGAPILPGALMQEMTTQTAGILIAARFNPMEEFNTHDPHFNEYALGVLMQVQKARYRSFARPGDTLEIVVELVERADRLFDFRGSVAVGERPIMQNEFRLANIRSNLLQASDPS